MSTSHYELVSLNVCPYVQRVVILLLEKNLPYHIEYIDPYQPPAWFLEWSPTGKVPVMRVDGKAILFESSVIMEYLEEAHPTPAFHPNNPLDKAYSRAWMEFSSGLFGLQYQLLAAANVEEFNSKLNALQENLVRIETQLSDAGPYFGGAQPNLTDIAIAPFFTRLDLIEAKTPVKLLNDLPKVSALSKALLKRPSVTNSVISNFADIFYSRFAAMNGHAAQWLQK